MVVCFTLTMPGNNSWDGRWSGDECLHAICRWVEDEEKARRLIEGSPYRYDFGDGWIACVTAAQVTRSKAGVIQRKSRGFAGYQWMVASLCEYGEIKPPGR